MKKDKLIIECETRGFDEATQEVESLAEAYDGFPAQVTIKNCRDCNINIHPSQTKMIEYHSDHERSCSSDYEDGYDDACMDLTDDDLGSGMNEEVPPVKFIWSEES